MDKKIKVFTLSDMPLSPSGVGTQTKYICRALLESGKFTIRSFGGAIKHKDYKPVKTQEHGDDWIMYPVDGYGSPEMVRSLIRQEKPDILWFMTDPRFWGWLWEMEQFYRSNDFIATISKVTDDIVKTVAPDVKSQYIPHAVDNKVFIPIEDKNMLENFKKASFGENHDPDRFIFFWNNRNARRKQSGSLVFWFSEFLQRVGKDKACLIMHTDVKDPHGQDLKALIEELQLTNGEVLFSQSKVDPQRLALMYNISDCTINIADAEGFGLATLESLSCGTPIIVNKTGGLQEQVSDGESQFGIGIDPSSKAVIGSQTIPWIYEDRVNGDEVVKAMEDMFYMSKEERDKLGAAGRNHVIKNYNFDSFNKSWVDTMLQIYEKEGSWKSRKNHKRWELKEL